MPSREALTIQTSPPVWTPQEDGRPETRRADVMLFSGTSS